MKEFEQFWKAYPRRVGKIKAYEAFKKAMRLTDLQTILEAIEAYKKHKPEYADFCHPTTWLNRGSWDDEWEERTVPMRDVSHEEYCAYLRSRGLHSIAQEGPAHPAYGKPMVPVDWRPELKVVKS